MSSVLETKIDREELETFLDEKADSLKSFAELGNLKGFELFKAFRDLMFEIKGEENLDYSKFKEVVEFLVSFEIVDSAYAYNALLGFELAEKGELPKEFYIDVLDKYIKPSVPFQAGMPFYQTMGAFFAFLISRVEEGPAQTSRRIISSAFGVSEKAVKDRYRLVRDNVDKIKNNLSLNAIMYFLLFHAICEKKVNWESEYKKAKDSPLSKKAYDDVFTRLYILRQHIGFSCVQGLKKTLEDNPPLIQLMIGEENRALLLKMEDANQLRLDDYIVRNLLQIGLIVEFFPNLVKTSDFVDMLKSFIVSNPR